MRITLIGYGKMGKAIEQIALQRGHQIVQIIDKDDALENLTETDCCIEFTNPSAAFDNLLFCAKNAIPVVCGTTGWYDKYDALVAEVNAHNSALITATNFSVGVNILFKINEMLAQVMNNFKEYDVKMEEIHHLQKLDHPSGTGITLAETIVNKLNRLDSFAGFLEGEDLKNRDNQLPILCKREPEIPGTHTIQYSSDIDELTISHRAKNRTGFATGAVVAAEWLVGKKGVYTMKDVLGL